jgi:hypothetical protein
MFDDDDVLGSEATDFSNPDPNPVRPAGFGFGSLWKKSKLKSRRVRLLLSFVVANAGARIFYDYYPVRVGANVEIRWLSILLTSRATVIGFKK